MTTSVRKDSWLFALLALWLGCNASDKTIDIGNACQLNSDCNASLVCTMGKCHEECRVSSDCPKGQSCVRLAGQSPVCQLPAPDCLYDSECAPLKCAVDRRCHDECQTSVDCTSGRVCTQEKLCAEPYQVDKNNSVIPADGGAANHDGSVSRSQDAALDTVGAGLGQDAGPAASETGGGQALDSGSGGSTGGRGGSDGGDSAGSKPAGGSALGGTSKGGAATGGAGGTLSSGGNATGGSKTSGGTYTGGTTAGGAVGNSCANLSFAPSDTGKAKPTGAAGGLKVLDWAGFKSAISYTFDDANSSQIKNYEAMNSAGGHYTFYLLTGKSEAGNTVYKTAVKDGHEMGNHTSDHSNCNNASAIDAASTFIKSTFNVTAYAFAAPNGSAACNTGSVSNKFLTNRSVNGGSMNPGDIGGLTWLPSDIASSNNMAPAAGKWRTICIHGFTGGSDGAYQPIPLDSFTSAVKSAVSGGSWVETVTNVAAYQVGQNALSKASGNNITWTLPAVFPPNMCLRVTTTGGTVKQNGKEVPWDDHGYYEIALDAKSLTIE